MITLNSLIKNMKPLDKKSNAVYYHLNELKKLLLDNNQKNIVVVDEQKDGGMILLPFYIFEDNKIMEIYDYELLINMDKNLTKKDYLKKKTGGKKDITDLSDAFVSKAINCYIEPKLDNTISIGKLLNYISYISETSRMSESIGISKKEFSSDNLYFEIY